MELVQFLVLQYMQTKPPPMSLLLPPPKPHRSSGKALNCAYYKGSNYLEIDVDIGSSAIANAILHLALGCVTTVTIDMGFVVEAQAEDVAGAVDRCD
ncbi:hypothetical protein glysoja_047027 [Glycine soja]|uniref:Protein ENHANCED DISEASE RESISTANCE 2 C-terminal domain-containing protein n=1 Tax=Glycine soja TaxID=3848 RepID=A0A0B2RT66_GLYSO|nr:hypothetical protein glysoja_047027 [Glycine soja]